MSFIKKLSSRIGKTERSGIRNVILKPLSMVLGLLYTPLLLSYLGDERYGLWATMLSIINWINYFDVGIGNGMRHILTIEIAEEKWDDVKRTISTGYIILTIIASAVLAVLICLTFLVNWGSVFSTEISMQIPLLISFIFICINFILALSNIILYAFQISEKVALRGCLVQIINIIGLLILRRTSSGNLIYMSILFGGSTLTVYIFNTLQIFSRYHLFNDTGRLFDRSKINIISGIGVKFFIIQIMGLMLFTVDNILITHYFGAVVVTPFSIADKVFKTLYTVLAAFLVPYWSRSTIAFESGDINWLRKSIRKTTAIMSCFVVGYIILAVIFRPLVRVWTGRELSFEPGLVPCMLFFYSMYSILAVECQFINGSGKVSVQMVCYILAGLLNIPFSIFLGLHCSLGVVGIRLATTILVSVMVVILGVNLHRIFKESKQNQTL